MSFQIFVTNFGVTRCQFGWPMAILAFRDELACKPEILSSALAGEAPQVFAAAWRASGDSEPCRQAVLTALRESALGANFGGPTRSHAALEIPDLQTAYIGEVYRHLLASLDPDESFATRLSYALLLPHSHPLLFEFLEECLSRGLAAWEDSSTQIVELGLGTNPVVHDRLFDLVLASPPNRRRLLNTRFGKLPSRQKSRLIVACIGDENISADELEGLLSHKMRSEERSELESAVYERRCVEIARMESLEELDEALARTARDKLGMLLREQIFAAMVRLAKKHESELARVIALLIMSTDGYRAADELRCLARRALLGN